MLLWTSAYMKAEHWPRPVIDRQARANAIDDQWSNALGGVSKTRKEEETRPFFVNLHEDERIAETLIYAFDAGETLVGKPDPDRPPKVELTGLGIVKARDFPGWHYILK